MSVHVHAFRSRLGRAYTYLAYILGSVGAANRAVSKLADQVKPDVVHHHNIFFLGAGVLRERFAPVTLYTAHDYWLICERYDLLRRGHQCRNRECLQCAIAHGRPPQLWRKSGWFKKALQDIDLILAPSRYMCAELQAVLTNSSVSHLANFVPAPPSAIPPSPLGSNYFLYVGALRESKGVRGLLDVFRDHHPNIPGRLVMAGNGPMEPYVRRFIAEHNLEERIVLLGWVERQDLWPLYRDARALVLPSIWPENNPLVALEALAVGTPVIGSDEGGIPEIVTQMDSSLLFRSGDWEGLAAVLTSFDKQRCRLRDARQVYEKEYGPERYVSRYESLAERLLHDSCT